MAKNTKKLHWVRLSMLFFVKKIFMKNLVFAVVFLTVRRILDYYTLT